MKKTKWYSPLIIYFLIIGSIFLCGMFGCIISYVCNPENSVIGDLDTLGTACFILGIGCVMFLGCAIYMIMMKKKWIKKEVLRDTGVRRDMIVVDLEVSAGNTTNEKEFGYVVCREGENSEDEKIYKSLLGNYSYYVSQCPIGSFIPVYIDLQNPENYFVDVDGAYRDKEKFQECYEDTEIEEIIEKNSVITFATRNPESDKSRGAGVFIFIGLLIFYGIIVGKGDSISIYLFFGFMGALMLTIGIAIIYGNARQSKLSQLVQSGVKFQGNMQSIKRRDTRHENRADERGYYLVFSGDNPITGKKETFSQYIIDPRLREERVESGTVNLYVNPEKPKDVYMDFSSCVLELKG